MAAKTNTLREEKASLACVFSAPGDDADDVIVELL